MEFDSNMTAFIPYLPVADTNEIAYAFGNSDLLGQAICVSLFIFSIVTWIVMCAKIGNIKKAAQDNEQFLRYFREKRNPLAITEQLNIKYCPVSAVYFEALSKIEAFHLTDRTSGVRRALSDAELGVVQATMDQAIEKQLSCLDKGMIFLQTAVSGSPFLGLFGTVWGITTAFTSLAIKGKADIQTLAPGVSGALLTTVIALFVAIPSLVGYNIISSHLKKMTVTLDNFAEEFLSRLKIEQLDSYAALNNSDRQV